MVYCWGVETVSTKICLDEDVYARRSTANPSDIVLISHGSTIYLTAKAREALREFERLTTDTSVERTEH